MTAQRISFRVTGEESGARIDRLVAKHAGALGRRAAAELVARGAVRVAGRVVRKGHHVAEGDEVTIQMVGAETILPEPGAPLDVRLETRDVIVVCKPAGQPTAPVRLGEAGTLASALLGRYPELAGVGHRPREPGLLHRLDTGTSGLVIAARSSRAFERLWSALTTGHIDKRYLAVVLAAGLPREGEVDAALEPDPRSSRRVAVASGGPGKTSVTRFRVVREAGPWALLEVQVRHAYRHQIRVHLASIGHPIAGDALYGGPAAPWLRAGHALHASYVAWAGDAAFAGFAVEAAAPADWELEGAPLRRDGDASSRDTDR